MFLTNERDEFVYVNRRVTELLGLAAAELVGGQVVHVVALASQAVLLDALQTARLNEAPQAQLLECALTSKYLHEPVELELSIRPVVARREVLGCVVIGRCLTERQVSLAQRLTAERVSAIGTLANRAADRINNPLAVLATHLGIIERAAKEGQPVDPMLIELMRNSIARIAEVTQDLATIADTSIQKLVLGSSIVDLATTTGLSDAK
jgi:PAS domain S-box-containing protein